MPGMNSRSTPERQVFTSRRMEQQWMRMQGVQMVRSGMPESGVARYFDVSVRGFQMGRCILRWWAECVARPEKAAAGDQFANES